ERESRGESREDDTKRHGTSKAKETSTRPASPAAVIRFSGSQPQAAVLCGLWWRRGLRENACAETRRGDNELRRRGPEIDRGGHSDVQRGRRLSYRLVAGSAMRMTK